MSGIDKTSTVLLLHGEDFTDSSLNPKSITNVGTTINTNGKFGKGLTFGSGQYLKISNGLQGVNLSKDFTIEWWEYSTGASSRTAGVFVNRTEIDSNYARGLLLGFNGIYLYAGNNDWNVFNGVPFKDKVDNVWVHWRLVKKGNLWTSYKNGTKFWSGTSNLSPLSFGSVCTVGASVGTNISSGYNAIIDEFRISNVALCDSNFELPTRPFDVVYINVTNQTRDRIYFNVSKGKEVINKIEVLVNGQVFKTYTEIGDLTYNIPSNSLSYGEKVIIRVTFDNNYTEEKEFNYEYKIDNLPTSSSLKELIDRQELLTNVIEVQKNNLKSILESKNVEVSEEENKLSNLIGKVDLLGDAPPPLLYLYKDGDECIDVTGGWHINSAVYGSVTKNSNNMYMKGLTSGGRLTLYTTNSIDCKEYKYLYFEIEGKTINYPSRFGIKSDKSQDIYLSFYEMVAGQTYNKQIVKIDISNIISAPFIFCNVDADGSYCYIYKIWLEK